MIQEAGSTSWRIKIDEPQRLVIGLFVRDVAGLTSRHAWLPYAAPATPRANEDGPEDAARQWDLWWDQALRADWDVHGQSQAQISASWWIPPNFESLQSAPELQGVVARHFSEAVAWSNDRKREHVELMIGIPDPRRFHRGRRRGRGPIETNLVADLERNLGRRAKHFRLRITEIPVAGKELWGSTRCNGSSAHCGIWLTRSRRIRASLMSASSGCSRWTRMSTSQPRSVRGFVGASPGCPTNGILISFG